MLESDSSKGIISNVSGLVWWSFHSKSARYLWLSLFGLLLLVYMAVLYLQSHQNIGQAHVMRLRAYILADQLRQSSDDLTRMVRTYVATGNPRYKRHYQEILDMRDGKSPRPQKAYSLYWDLVMEDDERPQPFGKAIPLIDLMQQSGFTEQEFKLLEESKQASDALTKTEYAAMALVESENPTSDDTREKAIAMLTNSAYHRAKADIMQPIARMYELGDKRTNMAIDKAENKASMLRTAVAVLVLLLLFVIWRLIVSVYSEREIHKLALYDALTQLPNRRLLLDRLGNALRAADRNKSRVGLLYLDLDEFKPINDKLGHLIGDRALQNSAMRMKSCLRASDSVARFGGDEFVVLLPNIDDIEAAFKVAGKLLSTLNKSFEIYESKHLSISASIGVAVYPDHAENAEDLIRIADDSMYVAKKEGKNRIKVFEENEPMLRTG